jgi:hypothetical protein
MECKYVTVFQSFSRTFTAVSRDTQPPHARLLRAISHFPIEQRTGSSRLFGGTKNKQYAEYGI